MEESGKKPQLVMYDVMAIQGYVFASRKLKENIGASIIVKTLFKNDLVDSIEKYCTDNGIGEKCYSTKWKEWEKDDFKGTLTAEVLYIGGGNAMVLYDTKNTMVEVNKKLSMKVLEKTRNTLSFAVAAVDKTQSFAEDYKNLFQSLNEVKSGHIFSVPLMGISITREGITDGLPATSISEDGSALSSPAIKKREEQENCYTKGGYFSKMLGDKYKLPQDIDNLGQEDGENHIAVVYIDGNNMGKTIETAISGNKDYETAIKIIRKLSLDIDNAYQDTLCEMADYLDSNLKEGGALEKKIKRKDDKDLPLRPIVVSGDELSFIVDGRIGLPLAEYFLEKISQKKITVNGKEVYLSACGGVAIVKSHFPFHLAYALAEELCSNAKHKAKTLAEKENIDDPGSWLDFHIVHSGVTNTLDEMRKRHYNVPGMEIAMGIASKNLTYKNYNLLWRPWKICPADNSLYEMKHFHFFRQKILTGPEAWPRSKSKSLREQVVKSKLEIDLILDELKSRGHSLPTFSVNKGGFFFTGTIFGSSNTETYTTPYFDVLDTMDFYFDMAENQSENQKEGEQP